MCSFACFCQCGCSDDRRKSVHPVVWTAESTAAKVLWDSCPSRKSAWSLLRDAIAGLEIVDEPVLLAQGAR